MSRGPDAGTLLQRALEHEAARTGLNIEVERTDERRWASATFTGTRHAMTLYLPADRASDAWLSALPDADIALRGNLLADLTVVQAARGDGELVARIEALTVTCADISA